METNEILKEIRDRMTAIKSKRAAELSMVMAKREEAREAAERAERDLTSAMEELNEDKYGRASQAQQKARAAQEMYTRAYDQLAARKLITEAESDAVIDSILAVEDDLAKGFLEAIAEPMRRLDTLYKEYRSAVKEAESLLTKWQSDIHPNFRSSGSQYRDAEGNLTNRGPHPIPVHRMEYKGCDEALRLGSFLNKNLPPSCD